MKYHSLKMEEVNDTMRHLWNKTYQGTGTFTISGHRAKVYHKLLCLRPTDIDGIKICSDSEGGATKRSYNYRVRIRSLVIANASSSFLLAAPGGHDEGPG